MGDPVSVGVRDPLSVSAAGAWLGLRPCTWVWLALVALTAVSFGIGALGRGGVGLMAVLLAIAIVKGHLISNFFMGLQRTSALWRTVMLVWLVIVGSGIAAAYLIGLS
jgi:caa(3)-type oxidase subunit IV